MDKNLLDLANADFVSSLETRLPDRAAGDAVVLMGGGQDSAAALLHFIRMMADTKVQRSFVGQKIRIHPIYFDYGQLTLAPELWCCREQLSSLEDSYGDLFEFMPLVHFKDPMTEFLVSEGHAMVGGTNGFTPGAHAIELRNLRFLAIAGALAAHHKAKWLVIGASPVSLVDNGYMATLATQLALTHNVMDPKLGVRIFAPLVMVHRSRVVQYLNEWGTPQFEQANFSCYTPIVCDDGRRYVPCETCPSCTWRAVGHRLAGIADRRKEVDVSVKGK